MLYLSTNDATSRGGKKNQTDVMEALQIIKSAGRPIMEHLHLFREFELELGEHQSNLQL
jgi:hypothetical protein